MILLLNFRFRTQCAHFRGRSILLCSRCEIERRPLRIRGLATCSTSNFQFNRRSSRRNPRALQKAPPSFDWRNSISPTQPSRNQKGHYRSASLISATTPVGYIDSSTQLPCGQGASPADELEHVTEATFRGVRMTDPQIMRFWGGGFACLLISCTYCSRFQG